MQQTVFISLPIEDLQTVIIDCVNSCLKNSKQADKLPDEPELLTIDEASAFLRLAKPTIYSMVSRGRLPYMKRAKKLYFSKVQLMDYLKAGKVNPIEQTTPEALQNVLIKTKGGAR